MVDWPTLASNEVVSMLGVMDSAGMVDADAVIDAAYAAIDRSGQVNIAGIVFNMRCTTKDMMH